MTSSLRLVSYETDGRLRAGIEGGAVVVDAAAVHEFGAGAPTLRNLLADGLEEVAATIERARQRVAGGGPGLLRQQDVRFGPPIPDPDKILCLGLNYADHATESQSPVPAAPNVFAKFRNCLVGAYDPIHLPKVSSSIDYEGELAVVIGRKCREVDPGQALESVAGYAVFNDVSARDLQFRTSQYTAGKALDAFAPMSGIVPAADVRDPQDLRIRTRVSGELMQDASTSGMVFPVSETIAFLSQLMTLEPGDIIATGTPAGVGYKRNPPRFLTAGDIVEVEIDGVGMIRNQVVAAEAPGRRV